MAEFIPDTGIIEIEKVDGSSNGLPGAKFNIVAVDVPGMTSGTIVTTIETGSNGKATVEKLPYGTYTITETQAPTGYALGSKTEWTVTVAETTTYPDGSNRLLITNLPITTSIQITKSWVDDSDATGVRPATITVILKDNGTEAKRATIGPGQPGCTVNGNSWLYTFEGLDSTKIENGSYSIEELEANEGGYKTTVSGYKITNTLDEATPEPIHNDEYSDNRTTPTFSMPSFTVSAEKSDLEGGFDGNSKTARGDANLAAYYNITWSGTGGVSGRTTLSSDEFGSAQSYTFSPWSRTAR